MDIDAQRLATYLAIEARYAYPLLFTTLTGSTAYGFAGPESDWDIAGVHVLPLRQRLGFDPRKHETIEHRDTGIDMVTHDICKFVLLLLNGNGNALEALYAPQPIKISPGHAELARLVRGCITKRVAKHYLGMAFNQQRRMRIYDIKKYLHVYRCLLMGIHIMQTGCIEMNISTLADQYHLPYIEQLIEWKLQGFEFIPDKSGESQGDEITQLREMLVDAEEQSTLPGQPSSQTRDQLEQFVIEVRMKTGD